MTTAVGSNRPRRTTVARYAHRLRQVLERQLGPLLSDDVFVRRQFQRRFGMPLHLHNPQMLVEKIQWLKLYDCTPLHTQCADKIRVRDYVAARIGADYLIPTILVTYDLRDISAATISADRFVIKTNHDYEGVVICKSRENFDWRSAKKKLRRHLKFNHYWRNRERAYRQIKPGLIVETFLEGRDGADIEDYKLHCFHGRVEFIQVISGRYDDKTITLYDRDWHLLPARRSDVPAATTPQPPPVTLQEMIEVAERLAEPFRFARVDLYEWQEQVRFGEITFYPAGGLLLYEPLAFEHQAGALLRLPDSRDDG